jgi:glycosyltransferase involved in cell wall biosynthesis
MNIAYITPSVMPSRSANSIHVARMCNAFNDLGHTVTLFVKRSVPERKKFCQKIEEYYGVSLDKTSVFSFYCDNDKGTTFGIAILALPRLLGSRNFDVILSRNLYVSYVLSFFSVQRHIFETHKLEYGFRKIMQGAAMGARKTHTVVISKALLENLKFHHGVYPAAAIVLPDAAQEGIRPLPESEKHDVISQIAPQTNSYHFRARVGYFGHLYPGRGIGVIKELAKRHPDIAFIMFGGNDQDIKQLRASNRYKNFFVLGHLSPAKSQHIMAAMDVLLMPYQKIVSIGHKRHNTSRGMSPMKMFEYMAVGVPIISSDLPVLREVLRDRENCLLAPCDDTELWSQCLNQLIENQELGRHIGNQAHIEYFNNYTWTIRARRMLLSVT